MPSAERSKWAITSEERAEAIGGAAGRRGLSLFLQRVSAGAGESMKRFTALVMVSSLTAVVGLAVLAAAQHEHGRAMQDETARVESREDRRAALGVGPTAEMGLKLTMREHLEAIRDIVAALGRQDFEQAAKVSHEELGFPKHHQAMEREAGATFPPKYHELAMAHHREAEDLARLLPSRDLKRILPQLDKTIGACVDCHRAFKL